MCGIFGIFSSVLPGTGCVKGALDSLRHRGPDDEGYIFINTTFNTCLPVSGSDTCPELRAKYRGISHVVMTDYNLLLAHRRLSILDLSPRGHQPMSSADGELWITYNGEIFNYRELRKELQLSGYRFDSGTDTEVILAAYQKWGPQCVHRFNGQWAFCIYDRKQKNLFCSRDRFGIKPFYYWFDNGTFAFASEIKGLLTLPFITRELNKSVISDFVIFCELDTSAETIYRGISQLLPSHNLVVDMNAKNLRVERYYELPYVDEVGYYDHRQALRYADDIRDLLVDSVKIRLISDVPVGSCLSGGLDSSSIVVIINKLLNEGRIEKWQMGDKQKTFTAAYDDPSVDERVHAYEVIHKTNVDAYFSYPTGETLWKELDNFLYHQDGICYATNVYASWDVMRLASHHVKVLLNGQGGDELFGGYQRYEILYLADIIKTARYKDLFATLWGLGRRHGVAGTVSRGVLGGCLAAAPAGIKAFLFKELYKTQRDAAAYILKDLLPIERHLTSMIEWMKSLNYFLSYDIRITHLPQFLHYDDSISSAFSIENRVPFVDHRLVEYVNGIPSIFKLHNGWSKWLLRLAMRDVLPEKILWRKDKLGFPTPEKQWLTHNLSPVPQLMKRCRVRRYSHFVWRLFLAERLINYRAHNNGYSSSVS